MNWILIVVFIAIIAIWLYWTYFSIRRVAKFIDNATFESMMRTGQVIDIRESGAFKTKHIMGARNLPTSQIKLSLSALRKDKPILLYDSSKSSTLPRVIRTLKKAGYTNLYVLKDGFDYWTGKVKKG